MGLGCYLLIHPQYKSSCPGGSERLTEENKESRLLPCRGLMSQTRNHHKEHWYHLSKMSYRRGTMDQSWKNRPRLGKCTPRWSQESNLRKLPFESVGFADFLQHIDLTLGKH